MNTPQVNSIQVNTLQGARPKSQPQNFIALWLLAKRSVRWVNLPHSLREAFFLPADFSPKETLFKSPQPIANEEHHVTA